MRGLLFCLLCFTMLHITAQKVEGVKVIPLDSLKKYKIAVAPKDSVQIYLAKNSAVYSGKMSFWDKVKYVAKLIYEKYTVLSWGVIIIVGFWLLSQVVKLVGKLSNGW